ncbi:MAG: hypothetical protein LBM73_02850 [Candidatus Nomurabacteria bacterium]|jgi:hypothetical protein|nr:hypothetical protein [Candidatus Nomurabacteria bacterium]
MYRHDEICQIFARSLPMQIIGDWIRRNSSYETELCAELGWEVNLSRYFDAKYKNLKIEIKKGHSILA